MPDFDVIVVGGGPAGATAAITCSRLGFKVLMVERGNHHRHKPCGGVLPPISDDVIRETIGEGIPQSVMSSPRSLGLYYVPPSGRENGGSVRNYRLLNVNRDSFDLWLREIADEEGVQILYNTSYIGFKRSEPLQIVLAHKDGRRKRATTRYLIGADGVYSRVRRQLYEAEQRTLHVIQEDWKAEGDFEDNFYAIFSDTISPTYGYIIPKDDLFVVGAGVPIKSSSSILNSTMNRLKEWLAEEFEFKPVSLERREICAVPYGSTRSGEGKIILVGDAAGLCNPLSGEGVRLAIRSGEIAGDSLQEAVTSGKSLAAVYDDHIEPLTHLIRNTHNFVTNLTDEGKEEFVKSELSRISLY